MANSTSSTATALMMAIKLINDTQTELINETNKISGLLCSIINEIKDEPIKFISPFYNKTIYGSDNLINESKERIINPYRFFFPTENSMSDFYNRSVYWKSIIGLMSKSTTECTDFIPIKTGEKWGVLKFSEGHFNSYEGGGMWDEDSFCECTFEICDQETIKHLGRTTNQRPRTLNNTKNEIDYVTMFYIPDYCIPIITQRFAKLKPFSETKLNFTLPSKKICDQYEEFKKLLNTKSNELKDLQQNLKPIKFSELCYNCAGTGLIYNNYPSFVYNRC